MITQIGGGLMSARAARAEGESKQSYYNYLAGENDILATRTTQAAAEQSGNIAEAESKNREELKRSTDRLVGLQRATQEASGVWGDSKTAEDVSRDTSRQESRDVSALRFNADSQIRETTRQAEEQARALREQGAGYRMSGEAARTTGRINAASSIISTASNVAQSYASWRSASTPTSGSTYRPGSTYSQNLLKSRYRPSSRLNLY